jgi:hypothetical protein
VKWFGDCWTVEACKALYRDLAKRHHPDMVDGDCATMQAVNAEYHARLEHFSGQTTKDSEGRDHVYTYNRGREQAIMDKIAELLRVLPAGVEVALIGYWLWITGTVREDTATRAALKSAGCAWNHRRGCWYWRPQEMRHWGRQSRGSLADLAMRYGCRTFERRDDQQVAAVA